MDPKRPLSHTRPTALRNFYYGVCYYPEHCESERWVDDAARMQAAGINLARMAEFAWSLMEPAEGEFRFDLFDRAIAVLAEHGIRTVLCTPTATPPRWLTHRHLDMLRVDANGRSMAHGSRQHISYLHPGYREHSKRITAAMADHFRGHADVIGWQTDNEINCHFSEDHSDTAQRAFGDWCRARFDNEIDRLNQAWGTAFWSNTYSSFDELVTPQPKAPTHLNPAHVLDYHRFLSDGAATFQRDQVELLRAANPHWWVTHNGIYRHIDYRGPFTQDLDFLAYDSYPMFEPDPQKRPAFDACRLDQARSWSGNFVVAEQQTGAGGQSDYMLDSPAPGEMRQFAWRSVARGADGVWQFRWRSCRFGPEQYWVGLVDHDDVGRRRYDEAAQLGQEFKRLGPNLLGTTVRVDAAIAGAEVAVEEAFEACHLGLPRPGAASADMRSRGLVSPDLHRCLFERGIATGFVHPEDDLTSVKLYLIPHWAAFDPAWIEPLRRWTEAGGVLLVGAMTATRDMNNNVVDQTPPGVFADLAGVAVSDYRRVNETNARPMEIRLENTDVTVPGEHWCERLEPEEGTSVIARWSGQWFDDDAAATRRSVGRGTVVYAGAWLTPAFTEALLPQLLTDAGVEPLVANLPARVEAVQRVGDDHRVTFLLNHADTPVTVTAPPDGDDLLSNPRTPAGLELPAFGVAAINTKR